MGRISSGPKKCSARLIPNTKQHIDDGKICIQNKRGQFRKELITRTS
jgi:hypothetical protein